MMDPIDHENIKLKKMFDALESALKKLVATEGYSSAITTYADLENLTEDFMEWIYTLGLIGNKHPQLKDNALFRAYIDESSAALNQLEGDEWIESFLSAIEKRTQTFEIEVDFYQWFGIPWRRSAVAFFLDFYQRIGLGQRVIFEWLEDIDKSIDHVQSVMGCFEEEIPVGIPYSHWWWWNEGERHSSPGMKQGRYDLRHPHRKGPNAAPSHPIRLDFDAE